MDLQLAGRVYVVTGGSRGLGYATAAALVGDGAKVVLSARDETSLTEAVRRLNDLGGEHGGAALGLAADLAAEDTARRLAEAAHKGFGRLDGALLSVGGPPPGTAAGATDEQWRGAFESVFLGAVRGLRVLAEQLGDEGGALGLVLSSSARSPITGLGISNGLRPGLAMVCKDMADEYGPRGIRVLGLLPGRVATDRMRDLDGADPAGRERALATIPLGRYGEPEEFGRTAAFVLSPAAGYLTGSLIAVDGGALRAL